MGRVDEAAGRELGARAPLTQRTASATVRFRWGFAPHALRGRAVTSALRVTGARPSGGEGPRRRAHPAPAPAFARRYPCASFAPDVLCRTMVAIVNLCPTLRRRLRGRRCLLRDRRHPSTCRGARRGSPYLVHRVREHTPVGGLRCLRRRARRRWRRLLQGMRPQAAHRRARSSRRRAVAGDAARCVHGPADRGGSRHARRRPTAPRCSSSSVIPTCSPPRPRSSSASVRTARFRASSSAITHPTGAFLALSAPSWSSQMLADVVQSRTVEQTIAVVAEPARSRGARRAGGLRLPASRRAISSCAGRHGAPLACVARGACRRGGASTRGTCSSR